MYDKLVLIEHLCNHGRLRTLCSITWALCSMREGFNEVCRFKSIENVRMDEKIRAVAMSHDASGVLVSMQAFIDDIVMVGSKAT